MTVINHLIALHFNRYIILLCIENTNYGDTNKMGFSSIHTTMCHYMRCQNNNILKTWLTIDTISAFILFGLALARPRKNSNKILFKQPYFNINKLYC